MAEDKEKKGKAAPYTDLIAAACGAYGIAPKYVLASRFDEATGEAVVVTQGGSKVRFKVGDKVALLSQIAVTGINPAWAKSKVIAGKAK
jgi:hypothetical protein